MKCDSGWYRNDRTGEWWYFGEELSKMLSFEVRSAFIMEIADLIRRIFIFRAIDFMTHEIESWGYVRERE